MKIPIWKSFSIYWSSGYCSYFSVLGFLLKDWLNDDFCGWICLHCCEFGRIWPGFFDPWMHSVEPGWSDWGWDVTFLWWFFSDFWCWNLHFYLWKCNVEFVKIFWRKCTLLFSKMHYRMSENNLKNIALLFTKTQCNFFDGNHENALLIE